MVAISALNAGLAGMSAASERLDRAARGLARPAAENDLPARLAELATARHALAAGAAVVRTADAMAGTLLDVLA